MAACAQCGKRANALHSCPGCHKRPLCLKCKCTCGWWDRHKRPKKGVALEAVATDGGVKPDQEDT